MSMVKNELNNTMKLFRVKIHASKRIYPWLFLAFGILFLTSSASTVVSIFNEKVNGALIYRINDYSSILVVGLSIGLLISMALYRTFNDYWSVLPQTNTARFVSTQLLSHAIVLIFGLLSLMLYLLQQGLFKFTTIFSPYVYFALDFDFLFVVTGFFVFIAYSSLIAALYGLIGVILRKWKIYAVIIMIAISALLIANSEWTSRNIPKIFDFLFDEPSLLWFFAKAVVIWLVMTAVSLLINYYTVYHQSVKKLSVAGIVLLSVVILFSISVVPVVLFSSSTGSSGFLQMESYGETDYFAGFNKITIDISHLKKGSAIRIKANENIVVPDSNRYSLNRYAMYLNSTEEMGSIKGDTLTVLYQFPRYEADGINVINYTNPKLTAELDGDTLVLAYTYDKAHIIISPIWQMTRQFDQFKGKNLLTLRSYSNMSMSGQIALKIE